jgi:hypothetical protein
MKIMQNFLRIPIKFFAGLRNKTVDMSKSSEKPHQTNISRLELFLAIEIKFEAIEMLIKSKGVKRVVEQSEKWNY